MTIDWITQACPSPDASAKQAALQRQTTLTKPAGSLGRLESLAVQFAAWQTTELPSLDDLMIKVFAADHGVCAQGVSAFPQAVTAQMVLNFLSEGAAISVLAKQLGADFGVVNLGTVVPLENAERLLNINIAPGTADFSQAPAMSDDQLALAINAGICHTGKADLLIGGEMGIGNTTSASAIYSAVLGLPAIETVGPGTGIDQTMQAHKVQVVEQALTLHASKLNQPLNILQHLGGFEIAALMGAYINAAQNRTPVLVDGFICTAAALLAYKINPSCRDWMLFAHKSAEPAHSKALAELNARPLLDLGMRLGEGSGAAVAVPIIRSALDLHANMATFADAGVSDSDA